MYILHKINEIYKCIASRELAVSENFFCSVSHYVKGTKKKKKTRDKIFVNTKE